ncbi:MAG TPA: hypothetical protein VFJ07_15180 [Streptosporangiaceae bacterium]|nr:hypothetical protein [Streptosporangiaceae bacterium]
MTDHQRRAPGAPITIGDVQGVGIAIGHGSSAAVTQWSPSRNEAVALLEELIRQLAMTQDSFEDRADLIESAKEARSELAAPSPRWPVVRGLLRGVAAGVAGIGSLADMVDKVQTLVTHLAR